MDAIVLVGGQGTRLRPLTATRHKSLIPLLNRPAFDYLVEWLAGAGVARIILALGQGNGDLARAYPESPRGTPAIVHVVERSRKESGGAIRNAVQNAGVQGRFLAVNGDIFADFDLGATLARHDERDAELTLALYAVEDPSDLGVAVVDGDERIVGFVEKPPRREAPSKLANAGVWIFESHLVDEIPPGPVRVEETLFPSLVARNRRIFGVTCGGLWGDYGTPERYRRLTREFLRRSGEDNAIHASARVAKTASVSNSAIGAGTDVGGGASVRGTILWEHVRLEPGSQVEDSILADGCHIGANARVTEAVLGAGAIVEDGAIIPAGTRMAPAERYPSPDD